MSVFLLLLLKFVPWKKEMNCWPNCVYLIKASYTEKKHNKDKKRWCFHHIQCLQYWVEERLRMGQNCRLRCRGTVTCKNYNNEKSMCVYGFRNVFFVFMLVLCVFENHFTSSPAHSALPGNGKLTWLAVREGVSKLEARLELLLRTPPPTQWWYSVEEK